MVDFANKSIDLDKFNDKILSIISNAIKEQEYIQ